MRMVFGFVLILGLGLAGFAVYMANGYFAEQKAALELERSRQGVAVPTQQVFVVNRTVRYGERLAAEDVRAVNWPQDAIPEGVFQDGAALFPDEGRKPRAVLRTMEKDEAILASKVTEPGMDAGVSSRLTNGMRAFAIGVNVSSGVSGFLRPGDRVDVFWSGNQPTQRGGSQEVTKLIETGVRLVAIDQSADEDRSSPSVARTVTVEATSRQVASLAQAQSTGRLSLALVGAEDTSVSAAVEIDQRDLLGIADEMIVEVEKERVCTIRTRRGADVVEIPVACTN
ncbi:Flp pilus assembly protein CpaB [Oceaniovalibus sp. ACAM 378]|uniref:Flp pilus assembly protein CpaB n=1 Tax=Oceaniovalibus sp. ACAM 378 TaxID=2599923 RepID=UPI0011DC363B|nr:Flp pilus assembly protein CpaB [Oceaniovalibus sp. ACAM 378]TYB90176.1 Flp pilus assembly protein CpaB [Oceaniovalibus sp. ACAM 378]